MNGARPRLSIEQAGRWTWAFFLREWRLLVPVAVAFLALPQVALQLLAPPLPAPGLDGRSPMLQPWMWWLAPVLLASLYGQTAITLMTLRPGASVGEALRLAVERTGRLLLALLLLAAALLGVLVLLSLAVQLAAVAGGLGRAPVQAVVQGATLGLFVAGWTRFILLMPVVAAEGSRPVAALRSALERSRGRFWQLFGLLLPVLFAWAVAALALQLTLGSVLLILGRALGAPDLGLALGTLLFGVASAVAMALFTVLIAAVYRQTG